MKRKLCVILIFCMLSAASLAVCGPVSAKGVGEAVTYIKARQTAEGGFAEPGASPDGLTTCWAMIAGSSAGEDVLSWKNGGEVPLAFLESQAESLESLSAIETYTLALAEAGADPGDFAGRNLPALIRAAAKEDGRIGENVSETCWGLIALAAAGEKPPPKTVSWLIERQRADGGWGESDKVVVTDTALAVQALVGLGEAEASVTGPAMKMLRDKMAGDGGFAGENGSSNTELTAQVLCAISAVGEDPASEAWTFHGNNPAGFLDTMQAADGHYLYSKGTESQPAMTTSMAVPAAGGKHLPLEAESAVASPANGIRDLGATGAGLTTGTAPAAGLSPGNQQALDAPTASGRAGTTGGPGGFWLFLLMCGIYILALAVAALAAAWLYVPRDQSARAIPLDPGTPQGRP
ncbi:MAG: hypothetical protein ACYC99_08890 [Candidatus Geothermincolia bacterium]